MNQYLSGNSRLQSQTEENFFQSCQDSKNYVNMDQSQQISALEDIIKQQQKRISFLESYIKLEQGADLHTPLDSDQLKISPENFENAEQLKLKLLNSKLKKYNAQLWKEYEENIIKFNDKMKQMQEENNNMAAKINSMNIQKNIMQNDIRKHEQEIINLKQYLFEQIENNTNLQQYMVRNNDKFNDQNDFDQINYQQNTIKQLQYQLEQKDKKILQIKKQSPQTTLDQTYSIQNISKEYLEEINDKNENLRQKSQQIKQLLEELEKMNRDNQNKEQYFQQLINKKDEQIVKQIKQQQQIDHDKSISNFNNFNQTSVSSFKNINTNSLCRTRIITKDQNNFQNFQNIAVNTIDLNKRALRQGSVEITTVKRERQQNKAGSIHMNDQVINYVTKIIVPM